MKFKIKREGSFCLKLGFNFNRWPRVLSVGVFKTLGSWAEGFKQ
jgi:hypothetical protein